MRLILLLATLALPALGLAQGALTPPADAFSGGAPTQTMKSLDQIEARTPIGKVGGSSNTISISQPGSYVLLGNVTVASGTGIWISSSNVTVDLNGFTISSTAASPGGCGIYLANGISQIRVGNGHIRGTGSITNGVYSGSGFSQGVCSYYADTRQVVIHDLTVECVSGEGIRVADNAGVTDCVVERCSVRTCGTRGIVAAIVRDSRADDCNWSAIIAAEQAVRCFGRKVHPNSNNNCIEAKRAVDCIGISTTGDAVYTSESATGCIGTSTSGQGIHSDGIAIDCRGTSNSGIGLQAIEATGCHGKSEHGTRGLVAANTATGCSGEIVTATGSTTGIVLGAYGLEADSATGCRGSIGAFTNSCVAVGIIATNASNSHGSAPGMGLSCTNAQNCTGEGSTVGILATGTASFCHASSNATAIMAAIAVACTAESGTINATQANGKQLGTQ